MKKFSSVFGIIAVILIFSLFAIGSGSDKASVSSDSASDNSKTTTQKADEPVKVEVGETLTTNTLKITYKSSADDKGAEYFPAASGNKIIKLTFEIENISSTDQIVSVYDFKCYSDDLRITTATTDYQQQLFRPAERLPEVCISKFRRTQTR